MELTTMEAMMQGQAKLWGNIFAFTDSMALRCALELGIVDIIHSHGGPITLSQIAAGIDSPSLNVDNLARVMRLLVRKDIFTTHHQPSDSGEITLYGLTAHTSRWLMQGSEFSLVPFILMQSHPGLMTSWFSLSQCVKEGGTGFSKVHGCEVIDFAHNNPKFNQMFNDAMACTAKLVAEPILWGYREGFGSINGSLVDVGGGTGEMVAKIVKAHPHIKAINFDLPHVITTAPMHQGVSHVEGNMFEAIPNADAILLKRVLHGFSDEDCIKILKNCVKAIPKKTGKIIIVEHVLEPNGNGPFDETGLAFDLIMMTVAPSGKERTELDWKKLLEEGGFPHHKIIKIPVFLSIIEAHPA
ncbi:desmethylxanthohumol 6'-O-methyltransferase-like [Juglans microcarpa x Juglans regia]|uniref:desmethylxanthohumol 6'-O-methyltransferase-like n=1 Tax=Juglans microcarpa x Juglans regia TaxID=2249226 RepID=UPI001B7F7899|nr:desmethylxanthohumol 6'-O-methyltransferase-like [Juglans microcarpa x Juglans regia]